MPDLFSITRHDSRQAVPPYRNPNGHATDITDLLLRAVEENDGSPWYIPPGYWRVSSPIVQARQQTRSFTPIANIPLTFVGAGPGLTFLIGHTGQAGVPLFTFSAPANPGYALYGGMYNLTLWSGDESSSAERGVGLRFEDTVFTTGQNLWVRGYTIGIHSDTCQDQAFRDVHVQVNNTGIQLDSANQVRLESFYASQNYDINVKYTGGPCSWNGGLNQGNPSIAGLYCTPISAGSLWLDVRATYTEIGNACLPIKIDAAPASTNGGSVRIEDINFNTGAGGHPAQLVLADRCDLTIERWTGADIVWLRATDSKVNGTGFKNADARFDLDYTTKMNSSWSAFGAHSLGLPPLAGFPSAAPLNVPAVQDRRFDIAIDLAPYLSEYWDARLGVARNAAGDVTSWTGQSYGVVLTSSTTKPLYGRDPQLNNEPVVKCVSASTSMLDSGVLAGGQIPPSGTGVWTLMVFSHPTQASGDQYFAEIRAASGDRLYMAIQGHTTAEDKFSGRARDHIGGEAYTTESVAMYDGGHIGEVQVSADPDYGFPGSNKCLAQLDGTSPLLTSGGNFTATTFASLTRFSVGSNVDVDHLADVNVALYIVCHATPPKHVREALREWLGTRFGTKMIG